MASKVFMYTLLILLVGCLLVTHSAPVGSGNTFQAPIGFAGEEQKSVLKEIDSDEGRYPSMEQGMISTKHRTVSCTLKTANFSHLS